MMKKIYFLLKVFIFSFIAYLFISNGLFATDTSIKDGLLNGSDNGNIIQSTDENGTVVVSDILVWIKDSLTSLLILIAVGVFLYIGIKLVIARGKPEEFKKAMMHMVYAIIGIFVVSLAWAAVSMVAGLNL